MLIRAWVGCVLGCDLAVVVSGVSSCVGGKEMVGYTEGEGLWVCIFEEFPTPPVVPCSNSPMVPDYGTVVSFFEESLPILESLIPTRSCRRSRTLRSRRSCLIRTLLNRRSCLIRTLRNRRSFRSRTPQSLNHRIPLWISWVWVWTSVWSWVWVSSWSSVWSWSWSWSWSWVWTWSSWVWSSVWSWSSWVWF